jgi:hypothetical protein
MDKIDMLRTQINEGKFPSEFPHFGGANLIITNDHNRKFHEGDTVIYSEYASALSWLVVQLKEINNSELDYINKYDFYPHIGDLIQSSLNANDELLETMLFVVEKMKEYHFR